MDEQWHVWTVIPNRYKKIKEFLSNLPEVEDFIYPTAEKEYNTKLGKKIRDVALYVNYIFLQYDRNVYTDTAVEICPWICNYIGKCSQEEINRVKISDKQRYEDLISDGDLYVGKQVKMIRTPFKDMISRIVEIDGEKLIVSITLFGDERFVKCSVNDVNIGD